MTLYAQFVKSVLNDLYPGKDLADLDPSVQAAVLAAANDRLADGPPKSSAVTYMTDAPVGQTITNPNDTAWWFEAKCDQGGEPDVTTGSTG